MLSRLTVLLVFLVSGFGAEASTLRGLVLANRLGGSPVANVEVNAPGVANLTKTGRAAASHLYSPTPSLAMSCRSLSTSLDT